MNVELEPSPGVNGQDSTLDVESAESLLANHLQLPQFKSDYPLDVNIRRLAERIEKTFVPGGLLVDVGGGFSVTNVVLAQLGMRVFCVDLMGDYFIHSPRRSAEIELFDYVRSFGVTFIHADLPSYRFEDFDDETIDVICSYHCLEHLHHSPQALLTSGVAKVRDGGLLTVELPNAANILKRLRILRGRTNYQPFESFFGSEYWVGHVREYTVGDLDEMATMIGADGYEIYGRNFYGNLYSRFRNRRVAALADEILQLRPGLCGSIHLDWRIRKRGDAAS